MGTPPTGMNILIRPPPPPPPPPNGYKTCVLHDWFRGVHWWPTTVQMVSKYIEYKYIAIDQCINDTNKLEGFRRDRIKHHQHLFGFIPCSCWTYCYFSFNTGAKAYRNVYNGVGTVPIFLQGINTVQWHWDSPNSANAVKTWPGGCRHLNDSSVMCEGRLRQKRLLSVIVICSEI